MILYKQMIGWKWGECSGPAVQEPVGSDYLLAALANDHLLGMTSRKSRCRLSGESGRGDYSLAGLAHDHIQGMTARKSPALAARVTGF